MYCNVIEQSGLLRDATRSYKGYVTTHFGRNYRHATTTEQPQRLDRSSSSPHSELDTRSCNFTWPLF
jgi:hypothetical protein